MVVWLGDVGGMYPPPMMPVKSRSIMNDLLISSRGPS